MSGVVMGRAAILASAMVAAGLAACRSPPPPPDHFVETTVVFNDSGAEHRHSLVTRCQGRSGGSIFLGFDAQAAQRHWLLRPDGSLLVLAQMDPCVFERPPGAGQPATRTLTIGEDLWDRLQPAGLLFDRVTAPTRVLEFNSAGLTAADAPVRLVSVTARYLPQGQASTMSGAPAELLAGLNAGDVSSRTFVMASARVAELVRGTCRPPGGARGRVWLPAWIPGQPNSCDDSGTTCGPVPDQRPCWGPSHRLAVTADARFGRLTLGGPEADALPVREWRSQSAIMAGGVPSVTETGWPRQPGQPPHLTPQVCEGNDCVTARYPTTRRWDPEARTVTSVAIEHRTLESFDLFSRTSGPGPE